MDWLPHVLGTLAGWPALLLFGALAFGESAAFIGLFLPGESALLLGGALASAGQASLPGMVIVTTIGAILGDTVSYQIGRRVGSPLRNSRLGRKVGEQRWRRAERFIARRGSVAVLLGRWVGVLRALVPALAGMNRMPYRRFLLYNALGGAGWASTIVLLGYLLGASWQRVEKQLGQAGVGLAVAVLAGLIIWWAVRHRRARHGHNSGDDSPDHDDGKHSQNPGE